MPSIYLTFFSLINYISVQMKLLIAAILLFCSLQTYSQQYWLEVSSPVTKTLNKSFFLDTINGWAIGDSGVIIHTSNGGINWAKQSSGISSRGFCSGWQPGAHCAYLRQIPCLSRRPATCNFFGNAKLPGFWRIR